MPSGRRSPTASSAASRSPELFRKLIAVAMELERRTMQLYCRYENLFSKPDEVRAFWFDMAEHESRHYGALAMVAGLLESAPQRTLPAAPALTRAHVVHLRELLDHAEREARGALTLARAFETALAIESSEIHDLGDLSYMIEKFSPGRPLLAKCDRLIEQRVQRLRHRNLRSVPSPPKGATRPRWAPRRGPPVGPPHAARRKR